MRISTINNYYNQNNSFKAKPAKSIAKKITNKALLPVAIGAYILTPLLKPIPVQTQPENKVQYERNFVMNNSDYKMIYVNSDEDFGSNCVSDIYFTPQDSDAVALRLENLTKYNADDQGTCGFNATVTEMNTGEVKNLELPEEIGKELLNLYNGKTDLFLLPGLNTYTDLYR